MKKLTVLTLSFAALFSLLEFCRAQWQQTNGPYSSGGVVSCFAVSGANVFAGTWGGVFLSTNNGTTWIAVNSGLASTDVWSLAVSGMNLFAGGWSGVSLSTNNGTSWTAVNTGLTNTFVQCLTVSGTYLFAGTYGGGVFLSTNNGTTWTAASAGLTNTDVRSLAVSGTNLFAATSGGGVFLSANNGTTWTAVNAGLTNTDVRSLGVSGTNLFAATSGGGVFLSADKGVTWASAGLTNTDVRSLAVSGINLFAGSNGGGVFLSTNNGTSWTAVNTGLTKTIVLSLAVSGINLFAGTDAGGVFLSTNNGTSWSAASTGLTGGVVWCVAASGTNLFAGSPGGVFLSSDNGTSWTAVNTGLTNTLAISLAVSGTNLIAGTNGGGVFLSTNNGTSWSAVNSGLTNTVVWALAVSGTNLFAGTWGGGVFLSTNNGTSWTAVNTGLSNTLVQCLAVSRTNLFAGTGGGVFLSTNNGTSWTAVNMGLSNNQVQCLAVSGTNLFAGTWGGGVFLSTNNGTSWTAVNVGLTNNIVQSFAVSGTYLFAGTHRGGVFLWTNNGTSWMPVNTGLANDDVRGLAMSGMNLFAGTYGAGVLRRPIAEMITPAAPVPASPANGSTGVSAIPTLSWTASTGAASYGLQVSTSADFSALVVNQSGITGTSYGVSLLNGTTYYWRVDATNEVGTSAWSSVWSFTTIVAAPSAPTLGSPANGATGVSANPTTSWNASAGAASYGLQVSTSAEFTTLLVNQTGIVGTSYGVALLGNTKYYWRVNATNAGGTSPWSSVWSFTTVYAPPVLALPSNGTTGVSTSPTLSWNASSGATSYTLQVSTVSNFLSYVVNQSGITGTSYTVKDLSRSTAHYWRVNATGTAGTSDWSEVWSFTTTTTMPPPAPALAFPQYGAMQVPTTQLLSWNPSSEASSYRLEVSTSATFDVGTMLCDTSGITGVTFLVIGLPYNTTCYWRVNAWNIGGTSPWSSVWSFRTVVTEASAPTLASPADGATGVSTSASFSWNASLGASWYTLQVSTAADFSSLVIDQGGISGTSYVVSLLNNTTYYWRVNATNAGGTSAWSSVWSFTTGAATTVEEITGTIPTAYALRQNFPNPFNPTTTIQFDIPQACKVTLKVFTLLGKEVARLVSEELQAGSYRVEWDARGVASGVYLCRMSAGSLGQTGNTTAGSRELFVETKRLVLIK